MVTIIDGGSVPRDDPMFSGGPSLFSPGRFRPTDAELASQVRLAVRLAAGYHHKQTDKIGAPYLLHPLRVWDRVAAQGADADVQVAALLHDVVEDCAVSPSDLEAAGISKRAIRLVLAVSRLPDAQGQTVSYEEFIASIARCPDRGAIQVKLADLADNMDPSRLAQLAPEKREALAKRYRSALDVLLATDFGTEQSAPHRAPEGSV